MPTYPYVSGAKAIAQTIDQLRKGFPAKVDSGYLQRFSIAPKNESYVLAVLRFLGYIDEEGARVDSAVAHFYESDDKRFQSGVEGTLRTAYAKLFDEMGDSALTAEKPSLVGWFRGMDKTSDLVGQRQATTFQALASYAGHGQLPVTRGNAGAKKSAEAPKKTSTPSAPKSSVGTKPKSPAPTDVQSPSRPSGDTPRDLGVTVRIEVNLPAGGDADTYDAIFASIRKHLMS